MARPRPDDVHLLYGVRPVQEALRAGRRRLHRLWIRKGRGGPEVARLVAVARRRGVPVDEIAPAELAARLPEDALSQGVVLEAGPLPTISLAELLAAGTGPEASRGRLLVALDGVEDPRNVGALARVAESAGAAGLMLTVRRAPPLGPVAVRASAGALETLPVARVANLARALDELKQAGWWVFGADPEAPQDIFSLPERVFEGSSCVVFGAEGRGLRPGVRRRIDHPVRIPMQGRVASLNVATAAAVVLFEWVRRGVIRRPPAGRA